MFSLAYPLCCIYIVTIIFIYNIKLPWNFDYYAALSITRTPSSDFCHNAKIYRPMYNTHPHFWRDRRQACIWPCIALPHSNCLDVAGMLALPVATKHCHHAPSPLTPRSAAADKTSSGSASLTGECVTIRFHGGQLTGMQCPLSVGCSVTVRRTCSRYSL